MKKKLKGKRILVIGKDNPESSLSARSISEAGAEVTFIDHTFQLLENSNNDRGNLDKYDMIFVNTDSGDQSTMENILLRKISRDLHIPVLSIDKEVFRRIM